MEQRLHPLDAGGGVARGRGAQVVVDVGARGVLAARRGGALVAEAGERQARPAGWGGRERRALGLGAFFGLAAYATYDLTSLALIRDFPLIVALVDLAWGIVLTTVATSAGYAVARG